MKILEILPITWKTFPPHQPNDFPCQMCHSAIATINLKCQIDTTCHVQKLDVSVCGDCANTDLGDMEAKLRGGLQTVKQASEILKVNESRVRQFIYSGRLSAQKLGRDLLIKTEDVLAFAAVERKTGRPTEQTGERDENDKNNR